MFLQGTASKAEVVQLKTKGFLLTKMNKVLPQAVKGRTWPILKEGFHPSTVVFTAKNTILDCFTPLQRSREVSIHYGLRRKLFSLLFTVHRQLFP